ncbi:MAG: transposase [Acidobacteria bacterium]|nr:transposase [Acidobacteriota bacterium]
MPVGRPGPARFNQPEICTLSDDYLTLLTSAAAENGLEIHAYQLMSNHVHLLGTPQQPESAARTIQSLGRNYVGWFNAKYERTGTLWEGRYRATVVDTEAYLLTCMKYVEDNARRAGMVKDRAEYRWSSYRTNGLGEADLLVTPHPVYLALGPDDARRQAAYRRLFTQAVTAKELKEIRDATNGAWALGSAAFQEAIQGVTGRRAAPLAATKCYRGPSTCGPIELDAVRVAGAGCEPAWQAA